MMTNNGNNEVWEGFTSDIATAVLVPDSTATIVSQTTTTSSVNRTAKQRLFCDVCWGSNGKRGMTLQTCRTCGVSVHNECYGIEGNEVSKKNPNFQCWACLAVGMTIKARERDPISQEHIEYPITSRPTECILCGVDDGSEWMHAMHPIYDYHGVKGRQIVLPATDRKPTRLAWAHTLCCFTINVAPKTAGCVYGCTQSGDYGGDDDDNDINDDDNDSDNSINTYLDMDLEDPSDVSIHHFVYVLPDRKTGQGDQWTKSIEKQQALKCQLCGNYDVSSYHIPRTYLHTVFHFGLHYHMCLLLVSRRVYEIRCVYPKKETNVNSVLIFIFCNTFCFLLNNLFNDQSLFYHVLLAIEN